MKKILLLFGLLTVLTANAQTQTEIEAREKLKAEIKKELKEELKAEVKTEMAQENKALLDWNRFTLSGYGVVNYYNYTKFDTDKDMKDKFDAERLNLYLGYNFNDWITFKSEIEFEHGGTGSTVELDTQEEFGEYEQEIEAGGEVKLEQVHVNFAIRPYFNVRVGRMKLHFGIAQNLDRPNSYFTTHRQEMENEILPLGWYENGIQFHGTFWKNRLKYEFSITNGLDASGFSSRGWIKEGYQTRFEMSVGNSIAFTGRLDYKFGKNKNTYFGLGAYINDAAANRPKNDMKETAYVTIFEGHVTYDENYLRFNSIVLYGNIENSNIVSRKNAALSNNLGVKRTPVGKSALGFSGEIGYEVLHFMRSSSQKVYPFMRYDYYDTMQDVEGSVVDNPRWERSVITGGINWFVHPQIALKAQYSNRRLGSQNIDPGTLQYTGEKQKENTFSAGIGFTF